MRLLVVSLLLPSLCFSRKTLERPPRLEKVSSMPENVYRRHPLLEIVDHPVAFTSEEQILANREEILQHDISDAEELSHESSSGGKSSMVASIFNLVNNVAGAGILTLSSGVAKGTGWVPALLICAGLGALSSHTFTLIGEACSLTDEVNFKGLWSSTMGEETAYLVDAIVAVMCFACSIIYQGILGDVCFAYTKFDRLEGSFERKDFHYSCHYCRNFVPLVFDSKPFSIGVYFHTWFRLCYVHGILCSISCIRWYLHS